MACKYRYLVYIIYSAKVECFYILYVCLFVFCTSTACFLHVCVNMFVGGEPLVGEAVASATGCTTRDDGQSSRGTTTGRRGST